MTARSSMKGTLKSEMSICRLLSLLDLTLLLVSAWTTWVAPSSLRLQERILSEESVGAVRFMKTSVADRPAGVAGGCMSRVCKFGKKRDGFVVESALTKSESHLSSTLSISHGSGQQLIIMLNWRC